MFAWLLNLLLCLIIWNIWKVRKKTKYEDIVMNYLNIIEAIRLQIVSIYQGHKLLLHKGKTSLDYLNFFKLPCTMKSTAIKFILWKQTYYSLGKVKC